jgi:hypothetical protein
MEKEPNALGELSEEQRDEINEAVGAGQLLCSDRVADLVFSSFLYSISTAIDI